MRLAQGMATLQRAMTARATHLESSVHGKH
jgi:hypothetical protein